MCIRDREIAGPEAQTDALCEVKKAALADARSQLSELEQALRRNPDQSNKDLTAELAVLVKSMEDELTRTLAGWSAEEAE